MENLVRKIQRTGAGLLFGWSMISCEQPITYSLESAIVKSKIENCAEIKLIRVNNKRGEGCDSHREDTYKLEVYDCDNNLQAVIPLGNYMKNGTMIKTEEGKFIVNDWVMGYEKESKKE